MYLLRGGEAWAVGAGEGEQGRARGRVKCREALTFSLFPRCAKERKKKGGGTHRLQALEYRVEPRGVRGDGGLLLGGALVVQPQLRQERLLVGGAHAHKRVQRLQHRAAAGGGLHSSFVGERGQEGRECRWAHAHDCTRPPHTEEREDGTLAFTLRTHGTSAATPRFAVVALRARRGVSRAGGVRSRGYSTSDIALTTRSNK